jgi:hypothetical protein
MSAGRKSTNAEVEERVTTVYRMLIAAASRHEILRHGSVTWEVTERQVEEYIARATKRLSALAAFVRDEEFGKVRARFEDLYRKNLKAHDLKEAHSVLTDEAKLLDLYGPTKVEHTMRDLREKAEQASARTGVPVEEIMADALALADGVN